jgi:hypothetical protein
MARPLERVARRSSSAEVGQHARGAAPRVRRGCEEGAPASVEHLLLSYITVAALAPIPGLCASERQKRRAGVRPTLNERKEPAGAARLPQLLALMPRSCITRCIAQNVVADLAAPAHRTCCHPPCRFDDTFNAHALGDVDASSCVLASSNMRLQHDAGRSPKPYRRPSCSSQTSSPLSSTILVQRQPSFPELLELAHGTRPHPSSQLKAAATPPRRTERLAWYRAPIGDLLHSRDPCLFAR